MKGDDGRNPKTAPICRPETVVATRVSPFVVNTTNVDPAGEPRGRAVETISGEIAAEGRQWSMTAAANEPPHICTAGKTVHGHTTGCPPLRLERDAERRVLIVSGFRSDSDHAAVG